VFSAHVLLQDEAGAKARELLTAAELRNEYEYSHRNEKLMARILTINVQLVSKLPITFFVLLPIWTSYSACLQLAEQRWRTNVVNSSTCKCLPNADHKFRIRLTFQLQLRPSQVQCHKSNHKSQRPCLCPNQYRQSGWERSVHRRKPGIRTMWICQGNGRKWWLAEPVGTKRRFLEGSLECESVKLGKGKEL